MQVTNISSRALEIAATGHVVAPGDSVEVEDDVARALAQQADVWHTGEAPERPARSAPKPEWVAYATTRGLDDADSFTKDELVARFTEELDGSDDAGNGEED